MRKSILAACILIAALAVPAIARAQDDQKPEAAKPAEPVHYYHLTLVVQDVDSAGKPTNSRSYAATISTAQPAAATSIRTGSRVPVNNGVAQFTYIDIGINFDVRGVHEINRDLSLWVRADISSYTPTENTAVAPIIRHNQWEGPVVIPTGKPTIIFSSDSLENKSAMQVVATVTPIP
jgi:hypothetical protein